MKFSRKRLSGKPLGKVDSAKVKLYCDEYANNTANAECVVSIDECHFSERVVPCYGFSPVGKRCIIGNDSGGWVSSSLLFAISTDGDSVAHIKTGSVRRDDFGEFVMNLPYPPSSVIIMDNCSIHKQVADVFEAKGYTAMFLPPYSPQLQPVEMAFSKVKHAFRDQWPFKSGVRSAIDTAIDTLTHTDVLHFFKHVSDTMHQV
jgi:hypothetical protein